jgi:hypothetical protein
MQKPDSWTYNPVKAGEQKYMLKGRDQDNFGSDSLRYDMMHRDVMNGPHNNVTKLDNPGPGAYKDKNGFLKLSDHDVAVSASGLSMTGMPV